MSQCERSGGEQTSDILMTSFGGREQVNNEYAFEMATSSIRFGWGATREVGMDLADWKVRRVMVVTDPLVCRLPQLATALESLENNGIEARVYDSVRVEPTDESCLEAARFASAGEFEAFVAIGGGSTIDTAKMANLYSTYPPEDFLDYVNPPIGRGLPPPGSLKPLIAVPTTAGTGSETTGVAIFDYRKLFAKTGVAHRRLKPTLGILDPENTRTAPPLVAACAGLDVLSHAIESYTALPYTQRPQPDRPVMRPAYQGSNPISDIWSLEALHIVAAYLRRAVQDPSDGEARTKMILAASYAGVGFGNAGVHLPHGMSYPVSGMVREFQPAGYAVGHPIVPHGMSVILNAPAVFRYTAQACPERHLKAAEALGVDVTRISPMDAGKVLADRITELMQELGMPNGLRAIGYQTADVPALVQGTLPQHRVTKLSPRPFREEELARMFEDAMVAW
jgi:hydroxyacid-oxoacid transhydrogenase